MTTLHLSRRTLLGSLGAGLLMSASRGAMAAQTLDALKKAGEIKIGCEAAYVPFTYRDSSGKIVGFDVDFACRSACGKCDRVSGFSANAKAASAWWSER